MSIKYGICQWNLPVKGPEGCYELKKLGMDGMELNFDPSLEAQVEEYKKAAQETGMEFPTLGLNGFCDTSYVLPGSEEAFEAYIKRALAVAAELGIKTLQLPAFFESDIDTEEKLQMAAKNLRNACELAAPYSICIGTENALDLEDNEKLFALVNHPGMKFYFDTQNLWRMKGKTNHNVFLGMSDRTVEAHAKDSLMINGEQQWMPLGEGDAEYASSVAMMKEVGYQGWIQLENDYQNGHPAQGDSFDFEEAIKKDLAILKGDFDN